MKRFRGGLVCKAHRLVNHSTLGLRVIKKRRSYDVLVPEVGRRARLGPGLWELGSRVSASREKTRSKKK